MTGSGSCEVSAALILLAALAWLAYPEVVERLVDAVLR